MINRPEFQWESCCLLWPDHWVSELTWELDQSDSLMNHSDQFWELFPPTHWKDLIWNFDSDIVTIQMYPLLSWTSRKAIGDNNNGLDLVCFSHIAIVWLQKFCRSVHTIHLDHFYAAFVPFLKIKCLRLHSL